jgi:hypothetical protein
MVAGRGRFIALLAVVLVANVALCGWWMHRNGYLARPIPAEQATCRCHAVIMLLAAERGIGPAVEAILDYEHWHGPVMPASAAAIAMVLGDRTVGPVATWITTCVLFGSLLLLGTWRLATGVGLPPGAAVAATALAAASPVVACYERLFFHQLPMAAVVTLALGEMVRTAGFTRIGASARTGLLVGLALITKNVAPMYLAGPALAELVFHRQPGGGWKALRGAGIALALAALVAAPWLAVNWKLVHDYVGSGASQGSATVPWWSLNRWTYDLRACANNGFGLVPVLVVAGLALLGPKLPARGTDLRVPVAQIVVTYPLLSLLQPIAESYFLVSWIPVLAIAAVELTRRALVEIPRVGRIAVVLLVVGAAINVALVQRGVYEDKPGVKVLGIELPPRTDHWLSAGAIVVQVVASSDPEHWPIEEFVDAMHRRPHAGKPTIVTTHPLICAANIGCVALPKKFEMDGRCFMPPSLESLREHLPDGAYFVHDDLYGDLALMRGWLADRGAKTEVVLRLPVTKERYASLLQVDWEPESRPR